MHIIYDEIKAGERGSRHLFNGVVDELNRKMGCEVIILACTELSVYKHFHNVPTAVWMPWMCLSGNLS